MEESFQRYLDKRPKLSELSKHIITNNWHELGVILDCGANKLSEFDKLARSNAYKINKMFQLWLDNAPQPTRRHVLDALRTTNVSESHTADLYESFLKQEHDSEYSSPSEKASSLLQNHSEAICQSPFCLVQVSQQLYTKRCIDETTLDSIESLEGSLNDKKTTLLTALHDTVSIDYTALKDIATVLSDTIETREIGQALNSQYEQIDKGSISTTDIQRHEIIANSDEERVACDILRNHYSTLSQSINEPVRLASLLLFEKIITKNTLDSVIDTRGQSFITCKGVLLKAVRGAVHSNYEQLELVVSVLKKLSDVVHIGNAIYQEYIKAFPKGKIIPERQCYEGSTSSNSESSVSPRGGIYIPPYMDPKFSLIRGKFGIAFYNTRCAIEKKQINVHRLKTFLGDCFSIHKAEFNNSELKSIDDVLEVVKEKCTLLDFTCLELIVKQFEVTEAFGYLDEYRKDLEKHCDELFTGSSLNETLQVTRNPPLLSSEKVIYVLDWNPLHCTLNDIRDIIGKASKSYRVKINFIKDDKSISVTCYVPAILMGRVIANTLHDIALLQSEGLKEVIVGNITVWSKDSLKIQLVSKSTEISSIFPVPKSNTKEKKMDIVEVEDIPFKDVALLEAKNENKEAMSFREKQLEVRELKSLIIERDMLIAKLMKKHSNLFTKPDCVDMGTDPIEAMEMAPHILDIFRASIFDICKAINSNPTEVSLCCVSHNVIPVDTHSNIILMTSHPDKASILIMDIYNRIKSHKEPYIYLSKVFDAFLNVKNPRLTEVVENMKLQLAHSN